MSEEEANKANRNAIKLVQETTLDCAKQVRKLRSKLAYTYWLIVALSIVLFIVGIVLILTPLARTTQGNGINWEAFIPAGIGIADLVGLFLYNPIKRIHTLMGDMSQVILIINSFQIQRDLRLVEMDVNDRKSVGEAAAHISKAAKESIRLIQKYFEEEE
jgi:hypothetical protein